jgi:hypothetical protein
MNILQKLGEAFSPNDPELVKKTLERLSEQDNWNDVFSTKLIELLDKIDQIKHEIRERLRNADERIQKADSVTQAESLLLEKAERYGDALQRLELAEAAEKRASVFAAEAKVQWSRAATALGEATAAAESALHLAETANQRSRSASETLLRARRFLRLTAFYATGAVALCWMATVWTLWFMIETRIVLWGAIALSIFIIAAAVLLMKGLAREF